MYARTYLYNREVLTPCTMQIMEEKEAKGVTR